MQEALGIFFVILDAFIVCLDRLAQRYLLQDCVSVNLEVHRRDSKFVHDICVS